MRDSVSPFVRALAHSGKKGGNNMDIDRSAARKKPLTATSIYIIIAAPCCVCPSPSSSYITRAVRERYRDVSSTRSSALKVAAL